MAFKMWNEKWKTVDGVDIDMYQCLECEQLFDSQEEHVCDPRYVFMANKNKDVRFGKRLETKFSHETVVETVRKIFTEKISFAQGKIEIHFAEYDELARKNIPFNERVSKVDFKQIEWLKGHIKKLQEDSRKFKVVPFSEWIQVSDYERMKRDGFYNFIRFWLDIAIQI